MGDVWPSSDLEFKSNTPEEIGWLKCHWLGHLKARVRRVQTSLNRLYLNSVWNYEDRPSGVWGRMSSHLKWDNGALVIGTYLPSIWCNGILCNWVIVKNHWIIVLGTGFRSRSYFNTLGWLRIFFILHAVDNWTLTLNLKAIL